MKLVNILLIAVIALNTNCHRHHKHHSHFNPIGLSDMNNIFKMMNNFMPMTQIKNKTENNITKIASHVAKVQGMINFIHIN